MVPQDERQKGKDIRPQHPLKDNVPKHLASSHHTTSWVPLGAMAAQAADKPLRHSSFFHSLGALTHQAMALGRCQLSAGLAPVAL